MLSQSNSVSIVTKVQSGLQFQGARSCFSAASRLDLGPTRLSFQWLPRAVFNW